MRARRSGLDHRRARNRDSTSSHSRSTHLFTTTNERVLGLQASLGDGPPPLLLDHLGHALFVLQAHGLDLSSWSSEQLARLILGLSNAVERPLTRLRCRYAPKSLPIMVAIMYLPD